MSANNFAYKHSYKAFVDQFIAITHWGSDGVETKSCFSCSHWSCTSEQVKTRHRFGSVALLSARKMHCCSKEKAWNVRRCTVQWMAWCHEIIFPTEEEADQGSLARGYRWWCSLLMDGSDILLLIFLWIAFHFLKSRFYHLLYDILFPFFASCIMQLKHPSALKCFGQIIKHARGKKIAIFLDYDGTLSPIVDDPDRALMSEAVSIIRKLWRFISLFPSLFFFLLIFIKIKLFSDAFCCEKCGNVLSNINH